MRWLRGFGLLLVGAVLMAGVGWWYLTKVAIHEPVWDMGPFPSVPLTVGFDEFEAPGLAAMEIWNKAAGCTLFLSVQQPEGFSLVNQPQVHVGEGVGEPCGQRTSARNLSADLSAGAYLCGTTYEIRVWMPGDVRQQLAILTHEFGEILNLAHDFWPGSPMYPYASAVARREYILPTDKDAAALRERYCR